MLTAEQVSEILETYKKYGWSLQMILLTNDLNKSLIGHHRKLFGESQLTESNIDAAWFSRPSAGNSEAWELRHLDMNPFALFETFDANDEEEKRSQIRKNVETRLAEISSKKV